MSAASAAAINAGRHDAGWTVTQLWVAATGVGGGFSRRDVERIGDDHQDATPLETTSSPPR